MTEKDIQPSICGSEEKIAEIMKRPGPVFLKETELKLDRVQSAFAVALHMHQPLIPAGGQDLKSSKLISNLDFMLRFGNDPDRYNANVFADCYGRMGDIVPELAKAGHHPRAMLDYSGELLFGLRAMGRQDIIERLKPIAEGPYRKNVEWLGTMWGHAVVPSTPVPDFKLHISAWQQEFAATFGWDALSRVRGFSPPEMHLPNHPDVAYEYLKALKDCGFRWLLVQEHTVEPVNGQGFDKHLPHRLAVKNSLGQEISMIAIIKTQGSDTKLVAQMQPYFEAMGQNRRTVGGISIPPVVTQIADGENGGVMMNEFPPAYRQNVAKIGTEGTVGVNVTEYLELIEQAGVTEEMLPALRPLHQGVVLSRIKNWETGAADKAVAEIQKENSGFRMDGGSWTNNISWVQGYENVLTPMYQLSAAFHKKMSSGKVSKTAPEYKEALFYLLSAETSCFRYWGQGAWTDYAREICDRGLTALGKL